MSPQEAAIAKLKLEIEKDISEAVSIAGDFGMFELLYFIYTLHLTRNAGLVIDKSQVSEQLLNSIINPTEESFKYIISLIAKFGGFDYSEDEDGQLVVEIDDCARFTKFINSLNAKYETQSLVNLFGVDDYKPGDRYIKLDSTSSTKDGDTKKLFDYFLRIDKDTALKKEGKQGHTDLLKDLENEYASSSDLFEQVFSVTLKDYCFLMQGIVEKITSKIERVVEDLPKLENGDIDLTTLKSFVKISLQFVFSKEDLYNALEPSQQAIIENLIFDKASFDENLLRFHYITRKPIIQNNDFFVISPELLLDSLFTNIHYSLIESEVKQKYLANQASYFLDKIVGVASQYGYHEVLREKDLFEGKKLIGDIDLMLKNADGHFLLIEAKNHALQLDVYFKEIDKTKEHLTYLQDNWEKKVSARIEHLKTNHLNYDISENYSYIIVSKYPEVISHYSQLFVISLQEFPTWLTSGAKVIPFQDFYNQLYETESSKLTMSDIQELQKQGLFIGKFDIDNQTSSTAPSA